MNTRNRFNFRSNQDRNLRNPYQGRNNYDYNNCFNKNYYNNREDRNRRFVEKRRQLYRNYQSRSYTPYYNYSRNYRSHGRRQSYYQNENNRDGNRNYDYNYNYNNNYNRRYTYSDKYTTNFNSKRSNNNYYSNNWRRNSNNNYSYRSNMNRNRSTFKYNHYNYDNNNNYKYNRNDQRYGSHFRQMRDGGSNFQYGMSNGNRNRNSSNNTNNRGKFRRNINNKNNNNNNNNFVMNNRGEFRNEESKEKEKQKAKQKVTERTYTSMARIEGNFNYKGKKAKYRKVSYSAAVSMSKNGQDNILIPIIDDNSGAYKILLHNDYLQLICIFFDVKDLLTKFVLLSKFYYMFIKSNDDNRLKRRIFETCLNYTFPNFFNDMKINGNNFKTNAIYQRYIGKLLTNWKHFIKVQRLLHNIPPNGRGNHDLYSLVSCDNCSIIIYWLKRVCTCIFCSS